MSSYIKIKEDVAGVEAVADVVRAVQRVAASHINRLKKAAGPLRDYVNDLRSMIDAFSIFYRLERHPLLNPRSQGERMLIVVFSAGGLVGAMDSDLLKEAERLAMNYDRLVAVGERGARLMRDEHLEPSHVLPAPSEAVTPEEAAVISDFALSCFLDGSCRSVDVLYAHFESLAVQHSHLTPFLPFAMAGTAPASPEPIGFPILSPSRAEVADRLLRAYLGVYFLARLTEAKLSELAARTVAMEHAGAQSEREVRRLTLAYFKERRTELSSRQIASFFAHRAI